jgi:guanylate kinase
MVLYILTTILFVILAYRMPCNGDYYEDEERLNELKEKERVIEVRSYNTKCGIWTYFTADDGQIDLQKYDYLVIGTLESYYGMREYFGEEQLIPIYLAVWTWRSQMMRRLS